VQLQSADQEASILPFQKAFWPDTLQHHRQSVWHFLMFVLFRPHQSFPTFAVSKEGQRKIWKSGKKTTADGII
jgi:hypothetical protein